MNKVYVVCDMSFLFSQKVVRCKGGYGWFVIEMVRLKRNCKDDGFVVASLRGLLDGRNQREIKNNDDGLRATRLSNKAT